MVLKRFVAIIIIMIMPVVLCADPLDGLASLLNFYGIFCIAIGIIGLLIPIMTRLRRLLVVMWAILCLLVSCIGLDTCDDCWYYGLLFWGPWICFGIGVILLLGVFISFIFHKIKETRLQKLKEK